MIRWMAGVSLSERNTNAELRRRIGVEGIGKVVRRSRLMWFGHVQRKAEGDWIKRCSTMELEGTRSRGRPKKTFEEETRGLGLATEDAYDRGKWRRMIGWKSTNPSIPG